MSNLITSTRRSVVVGLGVTGLSVVRYLVGEGRDVCVVDTRDNPPGLAQLQRELPKVPVFLGGVHQDVLNTAAELIVSPGIAPHEPWLQAAIKEGAALRGDIDLFMEAARAPVIGITGSNAKSTVTAWVGAMASVAGRRVAVGGNLGTAALDLLRDDVELYVLELSSFQLERATDLGLAVATVLNITPDHLDRHGTMPRYHQAKHRVFAASKAIVCNAGDPLTIPPEVPGRPSITWRMGEPDLHGFGLRTVDGELMLVKGFEAILPARELALPGRHNMANALAALAIGHAAELPMVAMLEALRNFKGLPHRCEIVHESHGVRWVNDSKATNVGAALAAIEGLGADSRLLLIAGGRDKDADFRPLRPAIEAHCDAVYLIGEAAEKLAETLRGVSGLHTVGSLDAAVASANREARPGQTVLLSPACASFDQFASYEQRGEVFRALARGEGAA